MLAAHVEEVSGQLQMSMSGRSPSTQWDRLADFVSTSPLVQLLVALRDRREPLPAEIGFADDIPSPERPEPVHVIERVIQRYLANMTQVKASAEMFGIVPMFVWQPIPHFRYDSSYHLFMPRTLGLHVNSKIGYPIMEQLVPQKLLGDAFVWAADIQADAKECLYVDAFHYTAPMCRRIAEFIHDAMIGDPRLDIVRTREVTPIRPN